MNILILYLQFNRETTVFRVGIASLVLALPNYLLTDIVTALTNGGHLSEQERILLNSYHILVCMHVSKYSPS